MALGVARLALDAVNHGYELVNEQVFDSEFIQYHCSRLDLSTTSLSSLVSKLETVGRTVSLTWNGRGDELAYPTSLANVPYSQDEVNYLADWADSLGTDRSRDNANILLALGLGAGLRNSEVDILTANDVDVNGAGVVVFPSGYRGAPHRFVPVSADYEDVVKDAVAHLDPDDLVFLPGNRVTGRSCASDFIRRLKLPEIQVTLSRMRATWIVRLMNAYIPEAAICDAAGLTDLQHYVHYRDTTGAVTSQVFQDQIRFAGVDQFPTLRAI